MTISETNKPDLYKMQSLIELAIILGEIRDFEKVLKFTATSAANLVNAETSKIIMINPQTRKTVKTVFTHNKEIENSQDEYLLHNLISGWVIKHNRSLISDNINKDARFKSSRFKNIIIKAAVCVPLKIEGLYIGTILVYNKKKKDAFDKSDVSYLQYLASISAPYLHHIQKHFEQYFLYSPPKESLIKKYASLGLLGKSNKFVSLLKSIEVASNCDVRVLLEGRSGTGKELIVKAIHRLSYRSDRKFIAIDCGAIPANLIESELFGHVKGAFTGASTERTGLLEEANGGTMFMDEIGNLPLELQVKLLRFLQEGEYRPLGSNEIKKTDVRIISATSVPLKELVEKNKFREDLFYRLNVFPIEVPSLNERREDIPLLANHFLLKFAKLQNKKTASFDETVLDFLIRRTWNGNIRELENVVERLVTLAPNSAEVITAKVLPEEFRKELKNPQEPFEIIETGSLEERVNQFEKRIITASLEQNDWNQSKAARCLKISEQTIRYKIAKLGIQNPKKLANLNS
ncbi:MAG: sigma-54-dependent Fis family transcriptional regulator [Calditrichaeota bacterium]|nr:sigma-54-dependent Fis family transcriptional regulator [Calditrichota bacterium]